MGNYKFDRKMLFGIVVLLLKALGLYLLYERILKMWYLRWLYGRRGVAFMSTIPKPLIGDLGPFVEMVKAKPDEAHFTKFLVDHFGGSSAPPCIGMFWPHGLELLIADPDYVQDLYVKYNEFFTKKEYTKNLVSEAGYHNFAFADSAEPSYKLRRKLSSHVFFGSKLKAMSSTVFQVLKDRFLKWPELYPGGQVDLVKELVEAQTSVVVSVTVGRENLDKKLPYKNYDTGKTELKYLGDMMNAILGQVVVRDNQLHNVIFSELLPYCISPKDRVFKENCLTLKAFFRELKKAKQQQIKQGAAGDDYFSILLNEGGEAYGPCGELAEVAMFDDITGMFLAATQTTQVSMNNLIKYIHMDKYKPVKEKVLNEIDYLVDFDVWDAQGQAINLDKLEQAFSYESIQDNLDYTLMCFKESLRIEPPVPQSFSHKLKKDVVLAKGTSKELKIRAGDEIHILMGCLHRDPKHWGDRYDEFIPERFDPNSEFFKAPDGRKRHPYAFGPFLGGHRICLGKTFAESVAKKLVAMLLKMYSLEHADEVRKREAIKFDMFQPKVPVINFKFAKRGPKHF